MRLPVATPKTEILTISEVSEYLKVAERTLYRLAAAKKIPAFKVGGTWRFSLTDIDRWIKKQSMDSMPSQQRDESQADGQSNNRKKKSCLD